MGVTKAEYFTEKQNNIASIAKALAHPARVAIIEHLMKVNSCICSDIVSELPLAQPTISQHLKELKSAGIIKGNVEGTSVCYCIDESGIEKIHAYFSDLSEKLATKKDNCC